MYAGYERDVDDLYRIHPIAMYRRLAEPAIQKRPGGREYRMWVECMEKWAEEIGAREKAEVSVMLTRIPGPGYATKASRRARSWTTAHA